MISQNKFINDVKEFISKNSFGMLSTHSSQDTGYPFGSIVKYVIDSEGSIIIYISLIAEHYKNLKISNKASLFIYNPLPDTNPLSQSRATLLLDFAPVEKDKIIETRELYVTKFPDDVPEEIESNFQLFIGVVQKIRWIKGFGEMGWISKEEYQQ